jgi:hypothetical protein
MAVPHCTITVWLHNWYLKDSILWYPKDSILWYSKDSILWYPKDSILWYPKEIMKHHVVVLFTAGQ